ncbi:hypothetical protein UNSWDHB_2227 [Dehalobacter sp. UNSWDHB]|jgi:hypothetical protein|nr:hypothetical protein DHBDCA_p1309 [Dehalobacter sp. DCA]AFV05381.1 hypothetical protein DCF50_p1375 [Dehalobacter sp. CF]EQB20492.1 hypothetical protein UNSWDHB_2227 [Dehalobacter sp. UNSWDHB]
MYEIRVMSVRDGQNDNYIYLGDGLELPASTPPSTQQQLI